MLRQGRPYLLKAFIDLSKGFQGIYNLHIPLLDLQEITTPSRTILRLHWLYKCWPKFDTDLRAISLYPLSRPKPLADTEVWLSLSAQDFRRPIIGFRGIYNLSILLLGLQEQDWGCTGCTDIDISLILVWELFCCTLSSPLLRLKKGQPYLPKTFIGLSKVFKGICNLLIPLLGVQDKA